MSHTKRVYLSGPMTGKKGFNIPAFDQAALLLRKLGYDVVSPAELDNQAFREQCLKCPTGSVEELKERCKQEDVSYASVGKLLERDIAVIADGTVEGIVLLSGYKESKGVLLEMFTAKLFNIPIYIFNISNDKLIELNDKEVSDIINAPEKAVITEPLLDTAESVQADGEVVPAISIPSLSEPVYKKPMPIADPPVEHNGPKYQCSCLEFEKHKLCQHTGRDYSKYKTIQEQLRAEGVIPDGPIRRAIPLVHGDRQAIYGHPSVDFARTAGIWSSLFGWKVEPADIPLAMIAVKLSRLRQTPGHEDSITDLVGYAETYYMTKGVDWPDED